MISDDDSKFKRWWHGNGASVFFMRYVPVINTIACVVHIAFLIKGNTMHYAECFAGSSLSCTLLLLALSLRFHFCKLHKALIIYDFAVEMCILLQWLNVFKTTLLAFRIGMLSVGVVLLFLILLKLKKFCTYDFM